MFPFDRFGLIHLFRLLIEILLLIFLQIFGSCRFGIIFGFNDTSSVIFAFAILLMASIDLYSFILMASSNGRVGQSTYFHIVFYSLMSLVALVCCVFSIIAFIYCVQNKYNRLCPYRSCSILWIGIVLTFFLTILYSCSAKLLCCIRTNEFP